MIDPLTPYYSSHLRGSAFDGTHTVLLWLTDNQAENGRIEKKVAGFLDYYLLFNFQDFVQLATDQERQFYLLDNVQNAVQQIVRQEGWAISRFQQAYKTCLIAELPVAVHH